MNANAKDDVLKECVFILLVAFGVTVTHNNAVHWHSNLHFLSLKLHTTEQSSVPIYIGYIKVNSLDLIWFVSDRTESQDPQLFFEHAVFPYTGLKEVTETQHVVTSDKPQNLLL